MKFSLDTHIWVWLILEPSKVKTNIAKLLGQKTSELYLSPVSVWEALQLLRKGKLKTQMPHQKWLLSALEKFPLREAAFTNDVALALADVELPHKDPADHFLVATAKVHGLSLVTSDENILSSRQIELLAN